MYWLSFVLLLLPLWLLLSDALHCLRQGEVTTKVEVANLYQ